VSVICYRCNTSWPGLAEVIQSRKHRRSHRLLFRTLVHRLEQGLVRLHLPPGTIQDWITALAVVSHPLYRVTPNQFAQLTKVKYLLLRVMILIPLGVGGGCSPTTSAPPFCLICPRAWFCDVHRRRLPIHDRFFEQDGDDHDSHRHIGHGTVSGGSFVKKRFFCFFVR